MSVGVQLRTDVRGGASQRLGVIGSQYFVAGLTERGTTASPVAVDSMADFQREFGDRVNYGFLTDDLASYFAEGGTRAHVLRVVGGSATKGTRTLVDRAGTPANTVKIDAIAAGAYSANIDVSVENGSISNTFTVKVFLDDELVDTYMNQATPAAFVAAVAARNRYITASNLGSATSAPNNNPAVLAAAALSAGTDDRGAVDAAAMLAAANAKFVADLGPGAVAIPGYPASDIGAGLIAHGNATGRSPLLHAEVADALSAARADALGFGATVGAEAAGLIHGWVKIPDPTQLAGDVTIPPTGAVAGVRARAIESVGAWRAPAGDDFQFRYVTGITHDLTATEIDTANDGHVIPIKRKGTRFELYGWRSLSNDSENFLHLSGKDTLNALAWDAKQVVEPFVFRPIDSRGVLLNGIASVLEGMAQRYADAGALYAKSIDGNEVDPGWSVQVTAIPEERRIEAVLAARIAETAELVLVTVVKVATSASV